MADKEVELKKTEEELKIMDNAEFFKVLKKNQKVMMCISQ